MSPPHAPLLPPIHLLKYQRIAAAGLWQQMERKIYFNMLTVGYEVPPATYIQPASHFIAFTGQRIRSSNQPNKFQMVFIVPSDSITGLISHAIYGVF